MAYNLLAFAGAGAQFFDNSGAPLTGGLIYTYLAGTTTPATTWTSSAAATANTNPIVLDSAGRTPNQIWVNGGLLYKFVLKTSTGLTLGTYDNIPGIDDPTVFNDLITVTGTNTLTGSAVPPITGYVTGATYSFVVANTNTGAVTISIDGLGAKNITYAGGTSLIPGQLVANSIATIEYDGTQFQLMNSSAGISTTTTLTVTGAATVGGTLAVTGNVTAASFNTGQLAGMRNKIINGDMTIAQRGTSFAAVSNVYTLDRWADSNTGTSSVVTYSQQADAPSSNEFQNSLRVAVTTADTSIAAGDVRAIQQPIEGYNVRDLIGKNFTLSFWVRSSKTGTHCVNLRNGYTADRSYVAEYTINAANTWEQKSITVSGGLITAGTWNWTTGLGLIASWVLACGTTYQTTANAWQTGNFYATSNQVNCLDSNTNIFAITGVQLEVGSVATPFEHRPIGAELALCQRYYMKAQVLAAATGNTQSVPLPVSPRVSPTITTLAVTAGSGATYAATGVASPTSHGMIYQSIANSSAAIATIETSGTEL